jgi:hypothetical protein
MFSTHKIGDFSTLLRIQRWAGPACPTTRAMKLNLCVGCAGNSEREREILLKPLLQA